MRSRRSSTVIGLASLLRDLSSAMEAGRAVDLGSCARAISGIREAAPENPASLENSRRVIIGERIIAGDRLIGWPGHVQGSKLTSMRGCFSREATPNLDPSDI